MNLNYHSILSSLSFNVKTKNMNFVEQAQLNLNVVNQSKKDETSLLQYNLENTKAFEF